MFNEIERLYKLGFAIHWLRPQSKMPAESGWTTGPRKTLEQLKKSYIQGMNVGVRLGAVSEITITKLNGDPRKVYLAVIDCDVKSAEPAHLLEMRKKLTELFPRLGNAPVVMSGRGNGSAHVYVLTVEPVKGDRLAQSTEKVRVLMPSVRPSKYETEALTNEELVKGWRLRAAWEISFMSEGRQVVLPPSIHPDSGKPYKWARMLKSVDDLPCVTPPTGAAATPNAARVAATPFKVVKVDLRAIGVPQGVIDMIDEGAGGDRSTELFLACISLVKVGLTDEQILSCLTDRERHLGLAAYDHAQTTDRARAAAWLEKYTLRKARAENDAVAAFAHAVEVSTLSPKENALTHVEAKALTDWEARIELGGTGDNARPKATLKNVMLILQNAVCEEVFKTNLFTGNQEHGCTTPWGAEKGAQITDADLIGVKYWLAMNYRVEPNTNLINEAVTKISTFNAYHPVRDYLGKLEWDGVERIDTWLEDYLGATAPAAYLRAVSRKTLCALIARVYEPGVKFDHVLILEGDQGEGKSTALRYLAGDEWFSDAHITIGDKDAVLAMRSAWLVELGELSGMRRAEVDALKEFVSRSTDRIRLPYGKRTEEFPRQCVFIGTTNRDEFLTDETGNRRFWPVHVGSCDFHAIRRDRDQLFAEARIAYELGEHLYLDNKEAAQGAHLAQTEKMESDAFAEEVQDFLAKEHKSFPVDRFRMSQAFSEFGPFAKLRNDRANQMRAGKILRSLGYRKRQLRDGEVVLKHWVKE